MELRQLSYFLKAAETQNFTEAASQLYITQSTLSQQIKQLEDELKILLFDRIGKKVYLTEAGNEFIPLAKTTVRDMELAKQKMLDIQKIKRGTLRVGITYSLSFRIASIILKFRKEYPDIKIELVYNTIVELQKMLVSRDIDFLLSFSVAVNEEVIEKHELFDVPVVVLVNKQHPLSKEKSISVKELQNYSLVLPAKGLGARFFLDRMLREHEVTLDPHLEMNDVHIILQMVESSMFITILAKTTAYDRPNLVAIPFKEPTQSLTACVQSLRGSYAKSAAKAFVTMLYEDLKMSSFTFDLNK